MQKSCTRIVKKKIIFIIRKGDLELKAKIENSALLPTSLNTINTLMVEFRWH